MKLKQKFLFLFLSLILILLTLSSLSFAQTKEPNKVYKVAILPFLIHSEENLDYLREGIYDILSSRITSEGRIDVIDRSIVEQALFEERPMRLDEAVATKIGMRVGADYIVLGSVTKIGSYISLDARLISITGEKSPLGVYTQQKGIDDVMLKIGDFAQDIGNKILGHRVLEGQPAEPKHPYLVQPRRDIGSIRSGGLRFKKSQTFDFEIKGLDIGDVYGDKKNELVVIDDHHLYIFKYDGNKMALKNQIDAGYEYNFLTLDVADINRDGYAEIIVTAVVEDEIRSFILEFEEGKFRKIIEKAGWYFRVLEDPKEGPILMGQRTGSVSSYTMFSGPIYRFVWKNNSFEKGPEMPFPKGTIVFGLARGEIRSKGTLDLILMEDSGRLRIVAPDGKSLSTGGERYGGTNNTLNNTGNMLFQELNQRTYGKEWRVYIPERILIKDLEGDGLNEVIVHKNISSTTNLFDKLRRFEKGEVYGLVWDEGALETYWKTKEINGYISDFQIKDVDNDGGEELVVAVIDIGGILTRKGTSKILFFKLF
jgi:TolB-like protein